MFIKLSYLKKNQNDFVERKIHFNEYFDLDDNEEVAIDSVPKYPQPYQFINEKIEDLIIVKLCYEINSESRTFNQIFWNFGNNILTERIDNGNGKYRELILSVKIDENLFETIRLGFGKEFILPTYHGFFSQNNTGVEIEEKLDTGVFIEMLKNDIL